MHRIFHVRRLDYRLTSLAVRLGLVAGVALSLFVLSPVSAQAAVAADRTPTGMSGSFARTVHEHSTHVPVPIPDSWTDAEVASFIEQSDKKIDAWAGRMVAPGEVIIYQGLEFQKSTPEMIAQRSCTYCPMLRACHGAGSVPSTIPRPKPEPAPASHVPTGHCIRVCLAFCESYKDIKMRHQCRQGCPAYCAKQR
jgi:hypothetical protein